MGALKIKRIAIATDFGDGVYVGQLHGCLHALVPEVALIDLVHDLVPFRPDLAAYLLPALVRDMPRATLYLCVVDPGVGGGRSALLVEADGSWFIGPDNGFFAPLVLRAREARVWRIGWQPEAALSPTFHGRDWFVPAAARLSKGEDLQLISMARTAMTGADWPREQPLIVYVDRYGNLMTGLDASPKRHDHVLPIGLHLLPWARTFCEMDRDQAFWYENAFGLVEIAVNQGRADKRLGLDVGDSIGRLVPRV